MSSDAEGGRPRPEESPKRQRPLRRAQVGWPPALRELKELLYDVYRAAGNPSLDEITEDIAADDSLKAAPSRDTVHRVITDSERSGQQAVVVAVATVLARRAIWDAPNLTQRVIKLWGKAQDRRRAGRPVDDYRSDVRLVLDGGLGVHPALAFDGALNRHGTLPAYTPRDHDARLKTVVDEAKAGRSGIAILVGGSSTGKTRALWEAVHALPNSWHLWHPLSPTAPDAVLAELQDIAPKTVVWLNEAQHYLGPELLGERVSAGLRQLLHDPSRAPVLVLGTLWPERWDTLTTHEQHVGVRELLSGHKIDVPDAFTPAHLTTLGTADDADPRLTEAVQRADDGQVAQYLAGAPVLMERYNAARGATLALIHAAMDARRLGAGLHIPLDWLADAALGYLTDTEYHALDSDWLSKALAYVTTPCNGIPGILTPVNTNGPRNQRTLRPAASGIPAEQPTPRPSGLRYLLADYLDQHGRQHRAQTIPPIAFWNAATHHAPPTDMTALGNAAWERGLYRDSAQLLKHATTYGNPHSASTLVQRLHTLHPTDQNPARWAAAHVTLNDPSAVAWLLRGLRETGANGQAEALLARDPAAHVTLDNPSDVALLLKRLRTVCAEQATLLAERAATHVALDDMSDVVCLLRELRDADRDQQINALAERAAAHVAIDNPLAVADLLDGLREAGANQQATALAKRAATHVTLDVSFALKWLLDALRAAGADKQATILVERAATHVAVHDPFDVAWVLRDLREAGLTEQAEVLLARNPAARVAIDDPSDVACLLEELREAGLNEQAEVLLARNLAAHVGTYVASDVAWLLLQLRRAGADHQATVLAERAVAHVDHEDTFAVSELLDGLREAGAHVQGKVLIERAAAHVDHDDPFDVAWLLAELGKAGANEQAGALLARDPAAHVAVNDPLGVASLLEELRKAGADEQSTTLAKRATAHVAVNDPHGVASLLRELGKVGANEQAEVLLARDPAAHVTLDNPSDVALLLKELRKAGADEQITTLAKRAAAHLALDNQSDITRLLEELRKAGAYEQITTLTERLPALGHFALFLDHAGNRKKFRLGREPDGSAAATWTWNDMV